MNYRELETALAKMHRVKPEGMGAFRSRLRVLRDIGVPAVSKPGKGSKVEYKFQDLWEANFALHLASFGLPPLRIKSLVDSIHGEWLERIRSVEKTPDNNAWGFLAKNIRGSYDEDSSYLVGILSLEDAIVALRGSSKGEPYTSLGGLLNLSVLTRECETAIATMRK